MHKLLFTNEPRLANISFGGSSTRSDTNQPVQLQKMARNLKF